VNHPLTNTIAEIAMLEERCRQKNARIEALEAALRKISEWPPSSRIDDIVNADAGK
jgi:hypothetical protein